MVQSPQKLLTLDEFLALPETKPASEYVNGTIIQKPMPQGKHSVIQRELSFALTTSFKLKRNAQAFPELRCTFGDRSIVPDISVFRAERIPRDKNGQIANAFNLSPDWMIEILSPGQSQTKVLVKILHCLKYETEMCWLIDPEESLIFVYSSDSTQFFEAEDSQLPVPEFAKAVQLTLGNVFGWLNE